MGAAYGGHSWEPTDGNIRQPPTNRSIPRHGTESVYRDSGIINGLVDRILLRRQGIDIYDDEKAGSSTDALPSDVKVGRSDINFRYQDGQTPLTAAIRDQDVARIQELLQHPGIQLDFPEEKQYSIYSSVKEPPLIVATKIQNLDIIETLLEAGADVDATDSDRHTALYHAAMKGDELSVAILLKYSSTSSVCRPDNTYDPIHEACRLGHIGVVKMLVTAGCSVDPVKQSRIPSPLDLAILTQNEDICLYLLENGANFNSYIESGDLPSFLKACLYGCNRVVEYLIRKGIDVNISVNQTTAFCYAHRYGDLGRIARRGKLNRNNGEPMSDVRGELGDVLCDSVSVMELLCKGGGYIDRPTSNAYLSPLCLSLSANNIPVCIVLLKHGAKWDYTCDQTFETKRIKRLQHFDRHLYSILLNMLDNKRRFLLRPRDSCTMVRSLKQCCRRTIRNCALRHTRDCDEQLSIIPPLQTLPLPVLLRDFLCYKELNLEYLITQQNESYLNYLISLI